MQKSRKNPPILIWLVSIIIEKWPNSNIIVGQWPPIIIGQDKERIVNGLTLHITHDDRL